MPKALIPTPDLHWSFDRRVIPTLVRDLLVEMAIDPNTPINYMGIDGKMAQQGTVLGEGDDPNRWATDERVFIEVSEEFDRDRIQAMRLLDNAPAFFQDEGLRIAIRAVMMTMRYTVTFRYRSKDRNQASMWKSRMVAMLSMGREMIIHRRAPFHYVIAPEWLELIEHCYDLRQNRGGDASEDFATYLGRHTSQCVTVRTDLAGNNGQVVYNGALERVQGWFDFDGQPEKGDREGDQDNWACSLTYTFQCDKPVMQFGRWPIVIHQQLLDEKWLRKGPTLFSNPAEVSRGVEGLIAAHFESDRKANTLRQREGVGLPSYSTFWPTMVPQSTVRVFTALCLKDPENPRFLCNLEDLGDAKLDIELLDWIRSGEREFMTQRFRSILQLNLYVNDACKSSGSIVVDEHLNVFTTEEWSDQCILHLRLGLMTNLGYLPEQALLRIRKVPTVAAKLIAAIDESIRNLGYRQDVAKNKLSEVEKKILLGQVPAWTGRSPGMNLIRSLIIEAQPIIE